MSEPTLATCRLCSGPLMSYELEKRLCSVCVDHAHQMGVGDGDLDKVVAELLHDERFAASVKNRTA